MRVAMLAAYPPSSLSSFAVLKAYGRFLGLPTSSSELAPAKGP